MINEDSFDLGYQKGRTDERAELRELLEKRMKMNDRKEKKAWRHDSCLGANLNGKVMEDKELLAELDKKVTK